MYTDAPLLILNASVSARQSPGNREFTSGACMTWRRAEALRRHEGREAAARYQPQGW